MTEQQPVQSERQSAERPVISVVVPTRNEADNLAPLAEAVDATLRDLPYEIVVVDDSTDDTPQVAEALASTGYPIRLIARPESRRNGLSGAVVEGFEEAEAEWVCVMDADLQHPPATIRRLLDQANRTGADLVVASRRADWLGPMGLSRARSFTSQSLTALARMLFPRVLKNVSDPLTGFFLVRRDRVDTAILQPEGFKILLEILVRHPELHVSEITFDFAPRHQGQSKADLNEGLRFFRHAIRLRTTVNQHLVRFVVLVLAALGLNLALLAGLVAGARWALLPATLTAGGLTLLATIVGERWVFSDQPRALRRRPSTTLLLGAAFLFLVYLPVTLLLARVGVPYLLASTTALAAAGFGYYLLSESWIWTRGLMMQSRESVYYDLHGILLIASQVPLDDLAWFRVDEAERPPDLMLRVDRHGTPSRVEGGISYDEQLGRFGFGLTVVPGEYTEIVVSPLLENSPSFLFTNVVEPVLRWQLISRDVALVKAGALAEPEMTRPQGSMIAGRTSMGYGLSVLCQREGLAFMADDKVILSRDGKLFAYPKPVTVNQDMLEGASAATRAVAPLGVQRILYSSPVRRLGLWLGERRLPVATLNTNLQRIVPQPKYQLRQLAPTISLIATADATRLTFLTEGPEGAVVLGAAEAAARLTASPAERPAFQPRPLLEHELATWRDTDWLASEQAIVCEALQSCEIVEWRQPGEVWWEGGAPPLSPKQTNQPNRSVNVQLSTQSP